MFGANSVGRNGLDQHLQNPDCWKGKAWDHRVGRNSKWSQLSSISYMFKGSTKIHPRRHLTSLYPNGWIRATAPIYRSQVSPVSSFLSVSLRPRAAISVVSLREKALQGSSEQLKHHGWMMWPNSRISERNFPWNSDDWILEGFLGNYQTFSPTHHSQRIFEASTTKTRVNRGCMKAWVSVVPLKMVVRWGGAGFRHFDEM